MRIRNGRLVAMAISVLAVSIAVAGCSAVDTTSGTVSATSLVAHELSTWTYSASNAAPYNASEIDASGPPGTMFPSAVSAYTVTDITTPATWTPSQVIVTGGNHVQILFSSGGPMGTPVSSDTMHLTIVGVQNPPAGSFPAADFTGTIDWPSGPSPLGSVSAGSTQVTPQTGLAFTNPPPPLDFYGISTSATDHQRGVAVPKPQATQGAFFFDVLQATGGVPPYTWSLTSGALPPGLALYPSGAILGTPTSAGSYTFTARVTDLQSLHFDESVTIDVQP